MDDLSKAVTLAVNGDGTLTKSQDRWSTHGAATDKNGMPTDFATDADVEQALLSKHMVVDLFDANGHPTKVRITDAGEAAQAAAVKAAIKVTAKSPMQQTHGDKSSPA